MSMFVCFLGELALHVHDFVAVRVTGTCSNSGGKKSKDKMFVAKVSFNLHLLHLQLQIICCTIKELPLMNHKKLPPTNRAGHQMPNTC